MAMDRIKSYILNRQYVPITVIICIGALLSALTFYVVRSKELQSIEISFRHDTDDRINAITREIENNLELVRDVHSLYRSSDEVTRDEFREFIRFAIDYSTIQALEWIPAVPHHKRDAHEKAAQTDGYPDFEFTEQGANGKIVRAAQRKEYFPVYYLEPLQENEIMIGFDLSSDLQQTEALKKAGDSGKMTASAPASIMQAKRNNYAFRVFLPVYRKHVPLETTSQRRANLTGFVSGVFYINKMVDKSYAYLVEKGIDVDLHDVSDHEKEQFIYSHLSGFRNIAEGRSINRNDTDKNVLHVSRSIDIGDREWMITARSAPEYTDHARDWHAWSVSASILLFTCMLSAYIKNNLKRTIQVGQLAENLSSEITARKKVEKAIIEVEERERRRIGHDLHDDLGQRLTGISFKTQGLENRLRKKSVPEAEDASRITSLIDTAKEQVKHLSRGLAPMVEKRDGNLILVLKELVSDIKSIYKIPCVLKCDKSISITDKTLVRQLYRIAQEAANNAVKHAKPDSIEICLMKDDDEIIMTIKDDGSGIDLPVRNSGMGLEIMKYRAGMINASLIIRQDIVKGTIVTCIFSEKRESGVNPSEKIEISESNSSHIYIKGEINHEYF
jgi:signal transduction histidine kinase